MKAAIPGRAGLARHVTIGASMRRYTGDEMRGLVAGGWKICVLAAALVGCGGGGDTGGETVGGGSVDSPPRIEPYERLTTLSKAQPTASGALSGPAPVVAHLGALAAEVRAQAAGRRSENSRRQIGVARELPATADAAATARRLAWQRTADGALVAAAGFHSDGARSVRVGLEVTRLPHEALVRVSGLVGEDLAELSGARIRESLARNLAAGDTSADGRTFWLPAVGGEDVRLEIVLPPGTGPEQVEVAVPRLSHLWVDLARGDDAFLKNLQSGGSGSCNVDASCNAAYLDEARAVAVMEFMSGGSHFLCTGTLMADVAATGTPWFLSARHCIGDQTAASSITTYWFFRSTSCNSGQEPRVIPQRIGGAELLFESAATDTAFMRLLEAPPTGALFAGSLLVAPAVGSAVAGLHHPAGDLLKLSLGSIAKYAGCGIQNGGLVCGLEGNNYAEVRWDSGTTERGSSGSALFTRVAGGEYVTGHLFAGEASCEPPENQKKPDYYGRFDIPYREALYRYLGEVPGAR